MYEAEGVHGRGVENICVDLSERDSVLMRKIGCICAAPFVFEGYVGRDEWLLLGREIRHVLLHTSQVRCWHSRTEVGPFTMVAV